jgi:aminoglycoside phosphotransferase family enzyme/predicted kinase
VTPVGLDRLLAELADPAAYPHPVQTIHVVQTATSAVFLTGDYAYKLKKPVRFTFLDYSTPERRHELCEREVALNRRLCPQVYLGVLPVVDRDRRLRIGQPGDQAGAVEWVVWMRQLPEGDMLPARLAAGTVTPAHAEEMASLLADFHAKAATGPQIRPFGAPEAMRRILEDDFDETRPMVGSILPREHVAAIRAYVRDFLRSDASLFERREELDRVRDGHGDLRAQNICLHEGIQIFDCIEFSDAFRYLDVANDLAYLAMDLDLAGRADLRHVLIRAYEEASGDREMGLVMRFYKTYRAYVRGEVALLALAEPEIPEEERQAHREIGAAAFDLARSYAQRPASPALMIMVGLSGSGKSALAQELARRLPAIRLASDALRKDEAGVPPGARLGEEAYSPDRVAGVYAHLREGAREWLGKGEHVVLDATFLAARERKAAAELARDCGAIFWIVECRCSNEVARRRIQARQVAGLDPSDAGIQVFEAQQQAFEPVEATLAALPKLTHHVALETDRPPHELARAVLGRWWGATV